MGGRRLLSLVVCVAAVSAGNANGRGPLVLDQPTGIAVESSGALLVVESGRHRLIEVAPSGRVRLIATFVQPWGVARAVDGTIYVGDGRSLLRVSSGGAKSVVATSPVGTQVGPITASGPGDVFYATDTELFHGTAAVPGVRLHGPHGLAVQSDGTLLVADTNANRVLAVNPASGAVATFVSLGHPRGIGVAKDGTVDVVAADEHRIVRFTSTGRRIGAIGPRFVDPYALSVAVDGSVYGVDIGAGVIRRIGDTWGTAPSLPTPRSAHAVVVAAGALYVLGGPGTTRVDRFDGRRWTLASHLPGGIVNAPVAAAVGRVIYVIGGFIGATNTPTDRVWVLDTSTRRWHAGPKLPQPGGGGAAAVLGGQIHVIGGGNDRSTLANHWVLDPATGRWSAAAPLPRAEGSPAAVVLNGKLYAIGGRSGLTDYGGTYLYDPATDRWTRGPQIPPRGTAGAAAWHGSIYLFGGESQSTGSVLGDVYRLTPGAPSWERAGRMPTARSYARGVGYRGRIYVVGGSRIAGDPHGATGSRVVEWLVPG